jgi:hypothetical protein
MYPSWEVVSERMEQLRRDADRARRAAEVRRHRGPRPRLVRVSLSRHAGG